MKKLAILICAGLIVGLSGCYDPYRYGCDRYSSRYDNGCSYGRYDDRYGYNDRYYGRYDGDYYPPRYSPYTGNGYSGRYPDYRDNGY